MAQVRVFGLVGKTTTRSMIDAVLASAGVDPAVPVVVALSADADASGLPWADALSGLEPSTIAVLNADAGLSANAGERGPWAAATSFGLTDGADVQARDLDATLAGTVFTAIVDGRTHRVSLRLLGEHQVTSALAALAVAQVTGVPIEQAIAALEAMTTAGKSRMEVLPASADLIVIDDTVSANGQSTAAALKALAQVAGARRSVAVLGELSVADGGDAVSVHDRIGRLIVRLNVKKLVVVGHGARHIHNAAGLEGSWDGESVLVDTPQQAYDLLRDELREQDVVLVKSSDGTGLGALAERLAGVTP